MKELIDALETMKTAEAFKEAMKQKMEVYEMDEDTELKVTFKEWLDESLGLIEMTALFYSTESLDIVATTLLSLLDSIVVNEYPEKGEVMSKFMLEKILSTENLSTEEKEQVKEAFKDEIEEFGLEDDEEDADDEEFDAMKAFVDMVCKNLENLAKGEDDE